MKSISSQKDYPEFKIVILTEKELSELVKCAVGMALQDPEILKTLDEELRYSRPASAEYLQVSLSTLDRIARRQPDILPKQRDDNGKPFFYRSDLDKYLQYRGN